MRVNLRALFVAAVFGTANTAMADYVVLDSDTENYTEGQLIPDDGELSLADGERLVLLSDTGDVLEIAGPFGGMPEGTSADEFDLTEALASLIDNPDLLHARLGATRAGIVRERSGDDRDLWMLDPFMTGGQCVIEGEDPLFWRSTTSEALSLDLLRPGAEGTGSLDWQVGETSAPWPQNIPLLPEELYVLRRPGWVENTMIHIALIPKRIVGTPATAVAWLAINGCKQQALELFRDMP